MIKTIGLIARILGIIFGIIGIALSSIMLKLVKYVLLLLFFLKILSLPEVDVIKDLHIPWFDWGLFTLGVLSTPLYMIIFGIIGLLLSYISVFIAKEL